MYDVLSDFAVRPEPFSRYTAKELWTRPHLARQMLNYHLSQETDLASRRIDTIEHQRSKQKADKLAQVSLGVDQSRNDRDLGTGEDPVQHPAQGGV